MGNEERSPCGGIADIRKISRRTTRRVHYGDVAVGGGAPVSIQSMSTFSPSSGGRVVEQVLELADAGCEIVRVSVKGDPDIDALHALCNESPIPVVADVHFDSGLAVRSAGTGVAGLRINPGNIGGRDSVAEVADAAARAQIPIRVGVNSGSIERDLRELAGKEPARALCESAERCIAMMEDIGFDEVVFSLKSSDPMITVEANRLFAPGNDFPVHLGVTEAGPALSGAAKSAVALTLLLSEGIGDTVRVSLSGDPVGEVTAAAAVLSALGLRDDIPRIISCPTCGRCNIDVEGIAERVERRLLGIRKHISVAVMGCEVNGPGEAKEADIGIAGSKEGAVLFVKGKVVRRLEGDIYAGLIGEVEKMLESGSPRK